MVRHSAGERHCSDERRWTGSSPSLLPGGTVDTRSVGLQCLARMFEAEPPATVPVAIADRAYAVRRAVLRPGRVYAGEPSLIARNAVSALAAWVIRGLQMRLAAVRSLGRPWLVRRVMDDLNRVYRGGLTGVIRKNNLLIANLGNTLAIVWVEGELSAQQPPPKKRRVGCKWLSGDWRARPGRTRGSPAFFFLVTPSSESTDRDREQVCPARRVDSG